MTSRRPPRSTRPSPKRRWSYMILMWSRGAISVLDEDAPGQSSGIRNPFDGIFHKTSTQDQTSFVVYSEFIHNVFQRSPTDVALFFDRGLKLQYTGSTDQHLFLPFIGGPDDRLALAFLVRLCANPGVNVAVVRIRKTGDEAVTVGNTHLRFVQRHTYHSIDAIADHDLGFAKTRKLGAVNINPLVAANANANGSGVANTSPPNTNKRPLLPADRKQTDYRRPPLDEQDRDWRRSLPPLQQQPGWEHDRDVKLPPRRDLLKEEKPAGVPAVLNWFVLVLPRGRRGVG
ncbi:hypothetical protein B0H13DRAFT_1935281 [Mycena leptocephala]|nr:hypothetical protein B0H13DRAFT_1935281 [Mycena leptocephala]